MLPVLCLEESHTTLTPHMRLSSCRFEQNIETGKLYYNLLIAININIFINIHTH